MPAFTHNAGDIDSLPGLLQTRGLDKADAAEAIRKLEQLLLRCEGQIERRLHGKNSTLESIQIKAVGGHLRRFYTE